MVETILRYPNCLRKAIDESGLTVKEVAEGTMIPLRTLFHYCTGQVPIPRKRLETLAAFIGYSAHDLVPSRIGTSNTNVLQSEDKQVYRYVSQENESALDKLRRQFLQLLLSGTSAILVVPSEEITNPDTWERLTWVLQNPYRTDTATVAHLEGLTDTYWELYRSALAKVDLLSSISGHLLTVTRLLATTQPASIQKRLCSIASNTAQMIGEVYFDMNDLESADHYYTLAIEAARQADNRGLWDIALGRQGFLSVYEGAFLSALPCFQEAYSLAENTTTGKSKSWLTMMEAEAHSYLKRKDDCFSLLEKTETVYTQDRSPTGADKRWTGFSHATMMGYKGICYVRLQMPDKARSLLQIALNELPSGPTRRRSLILADIATTYTQQEEIEEACTFASQALVYAAIYTSKVTGASLKHIDQVSVTAHLLQERIEKAFEVRVIVVGQRVFAIRINSQHSLAARVDFRAGYSDLTYEVYQLPQEVEQQCCRMVKDMGLQYSAIDLAVTKGGLALSRPLGPFIIVSGGVIHPPHFYGTTQPMREAEALRRILM